MKVGDIVKHFLTDQIGIILEIRGDIGAHVLWTTQGESLFGAGHKEWCFENGLTVLTTT